MGVVEHAAIVIFIARALAEFGYSFPNSVLGNYAKLFLTCLSMPRMVSSESGFPSSSVALANEGARPLLPRSYFASLHKAAIKVSNELRSFVDRGFSVAGVSLIADKKSIIAPVRTT